MQQLAYEEASRLFAQALELGSGSLTELDRFRLLLALASAMNLCGDYSGRLVACLEAAELARRAARPDLIAAAALVMEPVGQPGFDIATRRLCQEALTGLAPDLTGLRARTAARFAETFIYLADADAAAAASQHALELAEHVEDPPALAAALRARHIVCAGPDGLDTRARLAARMLALSAARGDSSMELSARCWQMDVAFERGDLGRVAVELDEVARCARALGGPLGRFTVLRSRAALAQAQGRFAEALRLADEAFALMAPTDHPARFHARAAVLGFVARHIGQGVDLLAARVFADAPAEVREGAGLIAALARAHALLVSGLTDETADTYRALGPVKSWRPPPHVVLLSYALGITLATGLGVTADVASLADLLQPYRGHHAVSGIGALAYFGPVELWLGVAAHHLGRVEQAIADLDEADRITAASGALGFQVEARYELARALADRRRPGDVARALQLLAEAARGAVALACGPSSITSPN